MPSTPGGGDDEQLRLVDGCEIENFFTQSSNFMIVSG